MTDTTLPPVPTPDLAPDLLPPGADALARAAAALAAGRLVAFPTETVYGLGGDAGNDRAVADIFAAKGRPSFNPLIVHLADGAQAERYAEVDERAREVMGLFWPGPLTLVLKRRADAPLSLLVSAGLDSVALRVPAHPTARALLAAAGLPLAAPSANRSGHVSPTTPLHVRDEFPDGGGGRLALILADGRCPVGLESTVLDLSGDAPTLLRPGAVTREELEAVLGPLANPDADPAAGASAGAGAIKAPGMLASHYAPSLPVRLHADGAAADEALLTFGPDRFVLGGAERLNLSPRGDLHEAAANLFAMLRRLDKPGLSAIAVMRIPDTGLGVAINDRLRRAAAPRG